MAGSAQPDLQIVFERIAGVIDRERRCALIEHAIVEQVWHGPAAAAITGCARPGSVGCSPRAA